MSKPRVIRTPDPTPRVAPVSTPRERAVRSILEAALRYHHPCDGTKRFLQGVVTALCEVDRLDEGHRADLLKYFEDVVGKEFPK